MALADHDHDLAAENVQLRLRVDQLESEIRSLRASTVKTVASAQETLYWFERWGVDFNRLMSRPQVELLRKAVRVARGGYRVAVKARRAVLK